MPYFSLQQLTVSTTNLLRKLKSFCQIMIGQQDRFVKLLTHCWLHTMINKTGLKNCLIIVDYDEQVRFENFLLIVVHYDNQ